MGPSDSQWGKILDFIEDDTEMRTGQFVDGPNGKVRLAEKWNNAAIALNELGIVHKTGNQWKEAYYGLRSRSRQAYADQVAYMRGTGGGVSPEVRDVVPNPVYARCLDICGTVTAIGNEGVINSLQSQKQRNSSIPLQQQGHSTGAHQSPHHTSITSVRQNAPTSSSMQHLGSGIPRTNHSSASFMPTPCTLGSSSGGLKNYNLVNSGRPKYGESNPHVSGSNYRGNEVPLSNFSATGNQMTTTGQHSLSYKPTHTPPHATGVSPARKRLNYDGSMQQTLQNLHIDETPEHQQQPDKHLLLEQLQVMQVTLADVLDANKNLGVVLKDLKNAASSNTKAVEALSELKKSDDTRTQFIETIQELDAAVKCNTRACEALHEQHSRDHSRMQMIETMQELQAAVSSHSEIMQEFQVIVKQNTEAVGNNNKILQQLAQTLQSSMSTETTMMNVVCVKEGPVETQGPSSAAAEGNSASTSTEEGNSASTTEEGQYYVVNATDGDGKPIPNTLCLIPK